MNLLLKEQLAIGPAKADPGFLRVDDEAKGFGKNLKSEQMPALTKQGPIAIC
jgi:hypothetical protein